MVVAPQSFGSLLNLHPHCHSLVSLGVLTRDGIFHPAPEDIDFAPLEDLFGEEVFKTLLKKEKITEERVDLLRSWRHSGFRVFFEPRIAQGERHELESLLQYMERAPVSPQRLTYRDDGQILYRGNFHPGFGRDYQLVSGLEFLAMLVAHIALRYECRIHCYGAISTTIRRQLGWIKKEETPQTPKDVTVVEEEESQFVKLRRKNWARLIAKVWLEDPSLCPSCGKEMRAISALTSPHQHDVIERILKSRGAWPSGLTLRARLRDQPSEPTSFAGARLLRAFAARHLASHPPWKRECRARGPPKEIAKQLELVPDESEFTPQGDDEFEFNQDPPSDAWD